MRHIQILLLSLTLISCVYGQEPTWTRKSINDILTVDLPSNYKYEEQDIIQGYAGNIEDEYFGVSYYNTNTKVSNAEDFKIRLTGFAHGMTKRVQQGQYQIVQSDTSIGSTRGILIKFIANAGATYAKNMICYVTIANDHFYSFLSTDPTVTKKEALKTHFYSMIMFDSDKIKETQYLLDSVLIK